MNKLTGAAGSYNPAPPIPFQEKELKSDNLQLVELNLKTSANLANNTNQRYKRKFVPFTNGTPEQVIKWRKELATIELLLPLSSGTALLEMTKTLTRGRARNIFDTKYPAALATANATLVAAGNAALTDTMVTNDVANTALNNFIAYFFPTEGALRIQKRAMRRKFFKTAKMSMRVFADRLDTINSYLEYFPPGFNPQQRLPEDEIREILYEATPNKWKGNMAV